MCVIPVAMCVPFTSVWNFWKVQRTTRRREMAFHNVYVLRVVFHLLSLYDPNFLSSVRPSATSSLSFCLRVRNTRIHFYCRVVEAAGPFFWEIENMLVCELVWVSKWLCIWIVVLLVTQHTHAIVHTTVTVVGDSLGWQSFSKRTLTVRRQVEFSSQSVDRSSPSHLGNHTEKQNKTNEKFLENE